MESLKVASVQFPISDSDINKNMEQAEKMVRLVMKEEGVDLLLFPELCLEGVNFKTYEQNLTENVLSKIEEFWLKMANISGIHILAGRAGYKNKSWSNLSTCFSPDKKILAEYAKTHLYCDERNFFTEGKERVIFTLKGFRIGMMICADLGFPEFSRAMASEGIDLFAVPSCWGYPHDMLWTLCNQMRAAENTCYLVSCNRIGQEFSGRLSVGHSMVTSPSGEILASLGTQKEGYFTYTLKKEYNSSYLPPVDWLKWIRPELYKI